jgi:hypothetical protein
MRRANPNSLTLHHHLLYALTYETGEVTAKKRSRRNKFSKLREHDVIGQEGPGRRTRVLRA